jgi:hypothetical protein
LFGETREKLCWLALPPTGFLTASCDDLVIGSKIWTILRRSFLICALGVALFMTAATTCPQQAFAVELPPLEKCFNAIRKELDPIDGVAIQRFKKDVEVENWDDLVNYTREYDAGFRGGVLKAAWKQLGDRKKEGIDISNSFTFDLISLNKAARLKDKQLSYQYIDSVVKDLENFLKLIEIES